MNKYKTLPNKSCYNCIHYDSDNDCSYESICNHNGKKYNQDEEERWYDKIDSITNRLKISGLYLPTSDKFCSLCPYYSPQLLKGNCPACNKQLPNLPIHTWEHIAFLYDMYDNYKTYCCSSNCVEIMVRQNEIDIQQEIEAEKEYEAYLNSEEYQKQREQEEQERYIELGWLDPNTLELTDTYYRLSDIAYDSNR